MRTQHLLRQKRPREQGLQRLQHLQRLWYQRLLVPLWLVLAPPLLVLVPGHPRS